MFANSSFKLSTVLVFQITHRQIHGHTDTQYDYHTLLPTLPGDGNKQLIITRHNEVSSDHISVTTKP